MVVDHDALARIADTQLGLVAWWQARSAGVNQRQLRHLVAVGAGERLHDGVFGVRGATRSYPQSLLAACLAIGHEAAASHRAAAMLHGLLTYRDAPIEVTTTRLRSPEREGVTVHRLADLHSRWVERADVVPVTTVSRTLVDLGAVASPRTVEAALDRAAGRRLVTYRQVRDAMVAVARRGRRGVGTIRPLLDQRIGEVIPAGVFEARMASLLRHAGLPRAEQEFLVTDGLGGFVAVVDFAYPQKHLAIEVDGYEFHSSPRASSARNQRDRLLADAGWLPLHFSWNEVEHASHRVGVEIRRRYSAR